MIQLMDLDKLTKEMTPVTSPEFFVGKTVSMHPEGLFSDQIFGPLGDDKRRRENFSYIDLSCTIFHPSMKPIFRRLNRKILDAMEGEKQFKLNDAGYLEQDDDGDISGLVSIIENFDKIEYDARDSVERQDIITMVAHYTKNKYIFINKCLVIPSGFRDITINEFGDTTVDPLNEYYVKILRLSSQMQSLQGPVYNYLTYRMFLLVVEMYDYLISKISKKTGLLRNNLLGKRIDFSARAVISGSSSSIKPHQLGIPFKILVKLYEPFILHDILHSGKVDNEQLSIELEKYNSSKLSHMSLQRLFTGIYGHDEIPEALENIIKESVIRTISDKVVIGKRDPSLHAESVQAFEPVLVHDNTILLHPVKCGGFNADFDGDQMALYVPITREAIQEARDKMIVSISKDSINQISDSFDKDLVVGIYTLTLDSKPGGSYQKVTKLEDITKLDIHKNVMWGGIKTTAGRVLFNVAMPKKYKFINEEVTGKQLNKIAADVFNNYTKEEYIYFSDMVSKLGFRINTTHAPTFGLSDFKIPDKIKKLQKELAATKDKQKAAHILDEMESVLEEYNVKNKTNLGILGKSGGIKGFGQVRQMLGAKGMIEDNEGNILDPLAESYANGLKSKDFFTSGAGSRKGITDRVLNTADTGYISRQLVYALQRVEVDKNFSDCRTKRGWVTKCTTDLAGRLSGRYVFNERGNVEKFDPKKWIGKDVTIKSPMYCLGGKICRTCYGDLCIRNQTPYVGILAGQICGEKFSSLIMATFHSGGAVSIQGVDIINLITSQYNDKETAKFRKLFTQKDNDLYTSSKGILTIDRSEYIEPNKEIKIGSEEIQLDYGYFKTETHTGELFDFSIDVNTNILTNDNIGDDKEIITIPYEAGKLLTCPPESTSFNDAVKEMERLMSGRKPWKSSDHFMLKIYTDFTTKAKLGADAIHLEVLVSQLLRDKGNPSFPARMNKKYDPTIVSLRKIPRLESWRSGLSFEHAALSISHGLVYETGNRPSVLEDIVTGNL